MPAKVYSDKDADLNVLRKKTLAVLGFGSQGHAHALNLKESGLNVIIGLYEGSKSIAVARERGFKVYPTAEAVRRADVIFVALPDTKQAAAYEKDIKPNLKAGKTLLFRTRLRHPLRDHRAAQERGCHPRRAQGAGPHRAPPIYGRQGCARAHRGVTKSQQAGQKSGARLGQGHRWHPRRRH